MMPKMRAAAHFSDDLPVRLAVQKVSGTAMRDGNEDGPVVPAADTGRAGGWMASANGAGR